MSAVFSSLRGLYWKETRQIIPLILILVGVALLLVTVGSAFSSTSRTFAHSALYIPMILPALYAAGAAALLVGQEKEQKTLWWLASLPTPASRLITVKFVVAFAGLVVIWLCCWLLTLLASFVGAIPRAASLPLTLRSIHLHSVFVLMCGFYSAWRLKNTFASLIAIIPLASIPLVVVQLGYALREQLTGYRMAGPERLGVANAWVTVAAIVVVGWLAYRAAGKNLRPAEPPRLTPDGGTNWLDAWRPTTANVAATPFRFSISSLVWQSVHHNRGVLGGIFAMLSFGLVCLALSSYSEFLNRFGGVLIWGNIVSLFGVSWLGVFVFTGDGSSERIRFLAERGVSPTRVWLGRQLIGVSLLSIALLLFASLSLWLLKITAEPYALVPSLALITLVSAAAYSVSQWTSQLLRLLAASAFVAPVLSAVAVYWFGFAAVEFDAPLWLLLVCGVLPMAATWLLMRRYMDGHRGLATWLTALGTVLLVVILPIVPMAIDVARSPGISASAAAKLAADAKAAWRSSGISQPITLVEVPDGRDMPSVSGAQALEQFAERSFGPGDRLETSFDDATASTPASIDNYIVEEAIALATYEKLRMEFSPDDEAAVESVGEWITALTHIAKRLRQSRGWWDQNNADLIEIWLTQTLSSESFEKLLDRDFSRAAINLVGDQDSRNRARRNAVLASMHSSYAKARFPLYGLSGSMSATKKWLIEDREREAIADAALRLIEAGSAGKPTEAERRELHDLTIGPLVKFVDGPFGDRMRVGTDGVPSLQLQLPRSMYPGCHWYAPWEADATRLASRQRKNPDRQDSHPQDSAGETP